MLQELQIENFALIESLQLNLEPGFTVFTGETGAGKSIIVDAIGLLVGARASAEYIRAGADRAVVRGFFRIDNLPEIKNILDELGLPCEEDDSLLLSREINRKGRHTCRVNGRSVTLSMYQKLGQALVDIHGQHSYQSILRPDYQRDMLDSIAGLLDERNKVKELYNNWLNLQKKYKSLCDNIRERERQQDFLNFQLNEIDSANLSSNEEDELYHQRDILNSAEKLASGSVTIHKALYGEEGISAFDQINKAISELESMVTVDPELQPWQEMLKNAVVEVEEVAHNLRSYGENLEYDPEKLSAIEERLELIKKLKRKYGATIDEILAYRNEIAATLENLDESTSQAAVLEQEIKKIEKEYSKAANNLSKKRKEAAKKIEKDINSFIKKLAMPQAQIKIDFAAAETGPTGLDNITFLFQPNPGEGSQPLVQIASGGEMSRVMLALKSILASVDAIPTLIFDEIDSGIGGAAAREVAHALANIGSQRQVFCITHSAQLSAFANQHYLVNKAVEDGRTFTIVEKLDKEARVVEIARLLSGKTSNMAKKHALTLLEESNLKK
ncbi:MAG: repair protein RecN [Clostridia bacterium]|nr:repair protein RecN [Clostridia bacterium]